MSDQHGVASPSVRHLQLGLGIAELTRVEVYYKIKLKWINHLPKTTMLNIIHYLIYK